MANLQYILNTMSSDFSLFGVGFLPRRSMNYGCAI